MALTLPQIWIPITTTADHHIDWYNAVSGWLSTPITPGTYNTPDEFLLQIITDMSTDSGLGMYYWLDSNWTLSIECDEKFQILNDSTPAAFDLGIYIGFDPDTTFTAGDTVIYPEWQMQGLWNPSIPVSEDGYLRTRHRASVDTSMSGWKRYIHHDQISTRQISFTHIPRFKMFTSEEGTHVNEALQRIIDQMPGGFSYIPDRTTGQYRICYMTNNLEKLDAVKVDQSGVYWSIDIMMNDLGAG